MKIISWNVNGLRAVSKKGFADWLKKESPDVLGLQEIKCESSQVPNELKYVEGYKTYFNPAARKGYSGTGLFTKIEPVSIKTGFGIEKFDIEGRIQEVDYGDFIFFNIYFPNGKSREDRLQYKLDFYDASLEYFDKLVKAGRKILIAGDYNTAHNEIDLARPKENEEISGFLPIERKWMDALVARGYIDCFREFEKGPNNYTWWSMRSWARTRNVGWRIDYFFCSANARSLVKNCYHLPDVIGSDHCPVVLEI
ncbi:MAG: exodeoxyribonuclease III [Patescibacteria group bacterium]